MTVSESSRPQHVADGGGGARKRQSGDKPLEERRGCRGQDQRYRGGADEGRPCEGLLDEGHNGASRR